MSSGLYCSLYFLLFVFIFSCFCTNNIFADEGNSDLSLKLGEKCQRAEQCQNATTNSTCSEGICACEAGFFQIQRINSSLCESNDKDKTDEEYVSSSDPPKVKQQHVDPKMIIIMVVLAVMFIGICVALHLFSKARFRNHRTIFNSPHPRLMHIKLGKKKGRRRASHTSLEVPGSRQLSICSQLSPIQSRRGSQATSPESTHKTRRSNGEKKESHAPKSYKMDTDKCSSETSAPSATNGPGSPTVIVTGRANKASVSARV